MVVSLLQNDYQRLAGGIPECRQSVMHDARIYKDEID
jgi:hypothetical protein